MSSESPPASSPTSSPSHDALAAEPSLEPGPRTDALFTRLVALAVAPRAPHHVDAVLADPRLTERLPDLRARCAAGEYALERSWAHRALAATTPPPSSRRSPTSGTTAT